MIDVCKEEFFKEVFVNLELEALGHILRLKAANEINFFDICERLEKLRVELRLFHPERGKQKAPHDLTLDDLITVKGAVEQARKKCLTIKRRKDQELLKSLKAEYTLDDGTVIVKPFPFPPEEYQPLMHVNVGRNENKQKSITAFAALSNTSSSYDTALELVALRFGNLSNYTVEGQKKNRPPQHTSETRLSWRLLASCFLEVSSYDAGNYEILSMILDCLFDSGYSLHKIYYLIQHSQRFEYHICLGKWDEDMIIELCNYAKNEKAKEGEKIADREVESPFSKLLGKIR